MSMMDHLREMRAGLVAHIEDLKRELEADWHKALSELDKSHFAEHIRSLESSVMHLTMLLTNNTPKTPAPPAADAQGAAQASAGATEGQPATSSPSQETAQVGASAAASADVTATPGSAAPTGS